ncbi:MAG: GAF domain-containing protein [Candidatus Zixiibacteriota bacterium]|nr:MAG: GAF domain-containing protein [candidate division Zixibacteria bacterium]
MSKVQDEETVKYTQKADPNAAKDPMQDTSPLDVFAHLEETLDEVARANPRLETPTVEANGSSSDLRALLEVSMAISSSLRLDDVLQLIMQKSVELMQAERGLIMLLDANGDLQIRSAYNLCQEQMMEEDFQISDSITSQVARTGKSVYASDAQSDDRYSHFQSVQELHLRSIMCVPLMVEGKVLGVIYLDNSSQSKMFLKSDLYLFELFAQMVSKALHNANMYESLLRLEQFSHSIVKNSPVGIVVLDGKGRIAVINPMALEVLDLNAETVRVLGKSENPSVFLDLLPESERPRWRSMINTVLVTSQEFADARYYHNTGYLEKVLSIKLSPLAKLPHNGDGLVMALEDVTEKITMEQYVILSEKLVARGEMAASIAHELNNFLAIISNNAELLSVNLDRNRLEKARFNSKSIVENVFKIRRFVESLMDFSKPEPEYINYDVRRLIDDLLFSLRIQPRFKLIEFTTEIADDMPPVEMDVGQIQQVLMNLLNNAADAISERKIQESDQGHEYTGKIGLKVTWDSEAETVSVSITDNGTGMSPKTLEKVFTLHFSTKKGGHGLGLYNCQKIAEQHGGTLVASSTEGEGSTFILTLPKEQKTKTVTA